MSEVITVGRVVPLEQIYIAKDEALIAFGYRNHESTFKKLWSEFKNHPDFKDGYRSATYGIPTVSVKRFDQFLTWKDKNKFK